MKFAKIVKQILNEQFSNDEIDQIKSTVKQCYDEKGNKGVRDYHILNDYLGKLNFEVDAADIKIDGWEALHHDRRIKWAAILLQGKEIGKLSNL